MFGLVKEMCCKEYHCLGVQISDFLVIPISFCMCTMVIEWSIIIIHAQMGHTLPPPYALPKPYSTLDREKDHWLSRGQCCWYRSDYSGSYNTAVLVYKKW